MEEVRAIPCLRIFCPRDQQLLFNMRGSNQQKSDNEVVMTVVNNDISFHLRLWVAIDVNAKACVS